MTTKLRPSPTAVVEPFVVAQSKHLDLHRNLRDPFQHQTKLRLTRTTRNVATTEAWKD
eukprot:SAG31_NODE_2114_length_6416_cov_25.024379_3_plen_58_part_00